MRSLLNNNVNRPALMTDSRARGTCVHGDEEDERMFPAASQHSACAAAPVIASFLCAGQRLRT